MKSVIFCTLENVSGTGFDNELALVLSKHKEEATEKSIEALKQFEGMNIMILIKPYKKETKK